jgi:5-hydroxyisourate hydrolase
LNQIAGISKMRIVTQVLDSTYGKSAVGVRASLSIASGEGDGWTTVAEAETNIDGCIAAWEGWHLARGLYRIIFDSDGYFARLGASAAYPEVMVIFRMQDESHAFQVQVTLSPYSYSTYFGTIDNCPGSA